MTKKKDYKKGDFIWAIVNGIPQQGRIACEADGEYWVRFRFSSHWLKPNKLYETREEVENLSTETPITLPSRIINASFDDKPIVIC